MKSILSIITALILVLTLVVLFPGCTPAASQAPTLALMPTPAPTPAATPTPASALAPTPELSPTLTTAQRCFGSDLVVKSTRTESILDVRESLNRPPLVNKYFLKDSQNVFLTVTFWVKPAAENRTIDMKDIVLAGGVSDRFYPVGFRFSEGSWSYVFTSGTCQLEFVSENQNRVNLVFDWKYDSTSNYGIHNDLYTSYSMSGMANFTTDGDPSVTLAYVVKREGISSGRLRLELLDSQPIGLEVR